MKAKNLWPKSWEWLRSIGIETEKQLFAQTPEETYERLREAFPGKVNKMMLYALCGAHWNVHYLEAKRMLEEMKPNKP